MPAMKGIAWLPAFMGAAVSVGLVRSSFAGFLFLLPLGVVAYCCNPKTAWFAAALSMLGNALLSFAAGRFQPSVLPIWADVFYLTVVVAAFAWITSPPEWGGAFLRISTAYRIVASAVLASLVLASALFAVRDNQGLRSLFRAQAEVLASLYANASGADEVRRSLTEHYLTADAILEILWSAALRGGLAAACVALFAASRQLSLVAAALIRRKRLEGSLALFHVRPGCIWALSSSLLAIVAGLNFGIAPLEIAGWNILVLCAILYLAQGGGIVIFFLARLPPRMRLVLNLCVVALILSPGINAAFMGALILLGVIENWAPLRALKPNGPPPTPGA
jgi:hypothetical protein